MKASSIDQTMVIINSLMVYLVDARYLPANPLALRRGHRRQNDEENPIERVLTPVMQSAVIRALNQWPRDTPAALGGYERLRLLLALAGGVGMRRHEIARAMMSDLRMRDIPAGTGRWIRILGKGNKTSVMPLSEMVVEAIERYRRHLGMTPWPASRVQEPLVRAVGGEKSITDKTVYLELKKLTQAAAALLRPEDAASADVLERASAHWLRHTYVTALLKEGASLRETQILARHGDINTTMIYEHTGLADLAMAASVRSMKWLVEAAN